MGRILVIDDESNIRSIIYKLLHASGYEVEVAEDGEKGIRLFHEMGDFDLVVSDIRMPNMDGNEVARYIRNSDKSGTPLIAMTGFPEELQMEMFDGILIKPFSLRDLIHMVDSFEKSEFNLVTELNEEESLGLQPL
jgi:two-component system response regulator ResD